MLVPHNNVSFRSSAVMSKEQKDVVKKLGESKDVLETIVTNARRVPMHNVRRRVIRTLNANGQVVKEEEIVEPAPAAPAAPSAPAAPAAPNDGFDMGDQSQADMEVQVVDANKVADILTTSIQEAASQIVDGAVPVSQAETLEDEADTGGDVVEETTTTTEEVPSEEEATPSLTTNNGRQYQRIANARIVRNANGTYSAYIPVGNGCGKKKKIIKKTTNVRRYIRRGTYNSAASDLEVVPSDVTYIPTPPQNEFETADNGFISGTKVKNYRRVRATNEDLNKAIEEAVRKALQSQQGTMGGTNTGLMKNVRGRKSRFLRFKNYRLVRNEDNKITVIVDTQKPNTAEFVDPSVVSALGMSAMDQPIVSALGGNVDSYPSDLEEPDTSVSTVVDGDVVSSTDPDVRAAAGLEDDDVSEGYEYDDAEDEDETEDVDETDRDDAETEKRLLENYRRVHNRRIRNRRGRRFRSVRNESGTNETVVKNASKEVPPLSIPSTFPTEK